MHNFMKRFMNRGVAVAGVCAALSACGGAEQPETSAAAEAAPAPAVESAPASDAGVSRLPVSLNAVMVAMVNHAADPIWVAAWRNPETDEQWRELERRAVQLELAGALLGVPGTGPLDDAWAGSEDWQRWSNDMRVVGENAVRAVRNRDLEAISLVGDDLVEICEGCHIQFKPNLPTGGEFGELSPTEGDFEGDPETP